MTVTFKFVWRLPRAKDVSANGGHKACANKVDTKGYKAYFVPPFFSSYYHPSVYLLTRRLTQKLTLLQIKILVIA